MTRIHTESLEEADEDVSAALENETERQRETLALIASENYVSKAVLQAQGSTMTNKYAEGTPGERYYAGCEYADDVERLAQERACELFDAAHANVQPHSGSQANHAAYTALLEPEDTILSLKLSHGGHLSHGHNVNFTGQVYNSENYTVDTETGYIDYSDLHDVARRVDPDVIVSGYSAYPREVDFEAIQDAAEDVGAFHMADIAHITGLVATGRHQNPVGTADVVTGSTHKTIRSGRGGMVLTHRDDLKSRLDRGVFPGVQGGPAMHNIAGKAVGFKQAQTAEFDEYIGDVVENAEAVAEVFESRGIDLVTGGTDTHLVLADLRSSHPDVSGGTAEDVLADIGAVLNANAVPNDNRTARDPSGIRVGTPAITSRGFGVPQSREVADIIGTVLDSIDDEDALSDASERVTELCKSYPVYESLE